MTSSTNRKRTPPPTPKRLRPSIRRDVVHPSDFLKYNFTFACEQCSHFAPSNDTTKDNGGLCTIGYSAEPHQREANLKSYELSGRMAFCRFLEVD